MLAFLCTKRILEKVKSLNPEIKLNFLRTCLYFRLMTVIRKHASMHAFAWLLMYQTHVGKSKGLKYPEIKLEFLRTCLYFRLMTVICKSHTSTYLFRVLFTFLRKVNDFLRILALVSPKSFFINTCSMTIKCRDLKTTDLCFLRVVQHPSTQTQKGNQR